MFFFVAASLCVGIGIASVGFAQVLTNTSSQSLQSIKVRHFGVCKSCPAFDITLFSSGLVVFNGHVKVNSRGNFTGNVSKEAVESLISELESIGIWSLSTEYIDSLVNDAELYEIALQKNGVQKTVKFNQISGRPGIDLYRMVMKVDASANVRQWICPAPIMNSFVCGSDAWSMPTF